MNVNKQTNILRSYYFSVKGRVTEMSMVVSPIETTGPLKNQWPKLARQL